MTNDFKCFNVIGKKNNENGSPMQTEKSQPSGQQIKTETRSFPALFVYPWVGISLSALEADVSFYLSTTDYFLLLL